MAGDLRPASFRGVPFAVQSEQYSGGRRVSVLEYPLRESSDAQDMGRKAIEYTIEAFVVGEFWRDERDALQEALHEPGPGELVHPRFGRIRIQPGTFTLKHPALNTAVFSITFHEVAPESVSGVVENLEQRLADATNQIDGLMDDAFGAVFDGAGIASDFARTTVKGIGRIVDGVLAPGAALADTADQFRADVSYIQRKTAAIVAKPGDLAARLRRTFRLSARRPDPSLIRAYRRALLLLDTQLSKPAEGSSYRRRKEDRASADLNFLIRGQITVSAVRVAVGLEYETRDEALQVREYVTGLIRKQESIVQAYGPELSRAFRDLRLLFGRITPGNTLKSLSLYIPGTDLPSLVIAQRLYGDPFRAAQIVARNGIRHPGLIRGDQPLSVVQ